MDRIDTASKAVDLFGAGKHGFKDGDLSLGVQPTDLDAEWFNAQQEEKMSVIEAAGVVATAGVYTQLLQALRRLFGGNVTTVNFAASPFALTRDHAGAVLVDATAGNVVLNLPAAALLTGLQFEFRRKDSSVNTVTINRAGADVIDEAETSIVLPPKAVRRIRADGATGWPSLNASAASQAEINAGTDDAKFVTSKKVRAGFAISLTASGYIAFPTWMSGLIIQWGAASVTGGTTNTVMLPIAFPTGAFMALATPGASATTAFQYATAYCPTASQIALNTNSTVVGVNFLAIGR